MENDRPYEEPKPKRRRVTKPAGPAIHPGSLTTLVDIDTNIIINGDARCRECNLIHAGECA
jgi:hypothetical protein